MLANILSYTHTTTSMFYNEGVPYELEKELKCIKSEKGTFYRGLRTERLLGEIDGNIWTPKGLCSTSKDPEIAKTFAHNRGSRGSFVVIKGNGKDITSYSVHSREEEVLVYQQQFNMFYCGQKEELDVWLAIEVGINSKPAVQTYLYPALEDVVEDFAKKPKYLKLNNYLSFYYFKESDFALGASYIGEVEIKGELYKAYKCKEHKYSSITSYFLEKDGKVLEFKLDWDLDKYDHIDNVFV